uniref:Uncharacterized protein n=1 Tax=Strigamia maritima TaxID=126957 RepID=T1IIN7_STRMM
MHVSLYLVIAICIWNMLKAENFEMRLPQSDNSEVLSQEQIELHSEDLKKADSVRAASGYAWTERQRFMERYWCRGKCIDLYYSIDTTITAKWDERISTCACNIHPK